MVKDPTTASRPRRPRSNTVVTIGLAVAFAAGFAFFATANNEVSSAAPFHEEVASTSSTPSDPPKHVFETAPTLCDHPSQPTQADVIMTAQENMFIPAWQHSPNEPAE